MLKKDTFVFSHMVRNGTVLSLFKEKFIKLTIHKTFGVVK